MSDKQTKPYTVKETADALGVSALTVYRWLYSGDIRGVKAGPKLWRIPQSEVERMTALPFDEPPSGETSEV